MTDSFELTDLARRIGGMDPASCRVVTGFDGFIDEMISVVSERRTLEDFAPVADIATFGAMVSASAGHSSLREIVITDVHPGGCAVNLADGLASLGVVVDCHATAGEPVHPAFGEIAAKCRSFHSWGREPGRTLAFEFNDGKLMFSAVRQLADFTPESVREFLADEVFATACTTANVIALTDWTLYPHMTAVWRMLQTEVFYKLSQRPAFFIDLVDPSGRSASDILEMAATLRDFEVAGPLTLGLNGNEANVLSRLHQLPASPLEASPEQTLNQAMALMELLEIHRVVIHRSTFAVSASAEGGWIQPSPFCPHPRKSTGAGDRFNAGFCLGLARDSGDLESLALGCAVAGFFVRHARSASHLELVEFLRQWADGSLT